MLAPARCVLKVQNGDGVVLDGLTILDRGYTGHEHLQSVGLINMNGRIYDPKLHRFLQPDNYVQDSFNTQNYNRYGYCWNNPLKYTDPSGEIIYNMEQALPSAGEINIRGFGGGGGGSNFVTTNNPFQGGTANSSPGNGTSLESFLQVLWDNSPDPFDKNKGTTTIWNNPNGTGIFYSAGLGTVNSNFGNRFTGVTDGYGVILPGVTIYRGKSDSYNANIIQNHVYQNRGHAQGGGGGNDLLGYWNKINDFNDQVASPTLGIFEAGAIRAASTISTARAFNRVALAETLGNVRFLKVAGNISLAANVSGIGYAAVIAYQNPSNSNKAKLAAQVAIVGIEFGVNALVPGLGFAVGFGLNAFESSDYVQNFYKELDK